MISQYATTSLITEQAKWQQKKIKLFFFQSVVFIDDSARCLQKRNTSWLSSSFSMQSILTRSPHDLVCCAQYLCHIVDQQANHMAGKYYIISHDVNLTADVELRT